MAKYYLQILAGVTNEDIVVDPQGTIAPGQRQRIPFVLSEADVSCDAILLCPGARAVRFALETPAGDLIAPADAAALPGIDFVSGETVGYFRFSLPVPVGAPAATGTWHAVLEVDRAGFKRQLAEIKRRQPHLYSSIATHGLPYSLNVHAYSNLRLRISLAQDGQEPGARLLLRGVLTEYGLPISGRARVHAELMRPDGTGATLPMPESAPGIFEASLPTTLAGVYRFTVKAAGRTLRRRPFTREQIVTGQGAATSRRRAGRTIRLAAAGISATWSAACSAPAWSRLVLWPRSAPMDSISKRSGSAAGTRSRPLQHQGSRPRSRA